MLDQRLPHDFIRPFVTAGLHQLGNVVFQISRQRDIYAVKLMRCEILSICNLRQRLPVAPFCFREIIFGMRTVSRRGVSSVCRGDTVRAPNAKILRYWLPSFDMKKAMIG